MSADRTRTYMFTVLLIVLALAGAALAAFSTPKGLGLVNDSVAYINGARGLVEGSGYGRIAGDGTIRPVTHFPPGFSVVLALFGMFGVKAIPAARIANLALFAANIALAGLLARRVTRSGAAGLLAAALFAFSDALLGVHAFVLSEPLFLVLSLAGMLVLARYFDLHIRSPRAPAATLALVAAGDLAGLAYLTRYVGVALLAAAVALLAFSGTWKERLRRVAIFLGSALVWILVWTVRNASLTGSATNRSLAYHAIPAQNIREGLRNLWGFLLPRRIPVYDLLPEALWAVLTGLLLAGLVAALIWGLRRLWRGQTGQAGAWLVGLHLAAYLALIVFSMTFVDASTTFEDRILAPLFADVTILLAWGFAGLARRAGGALRPAVIILALLLVLTFADDARKVALELRVDGQGFASSYWTNSQTMDHTRRLPDVTIYSDRISAVTLLADRQAYALLSPVDPVTREPRPNFEKTQRDIRAALLDGRAVLVVFAIDELEGQQWFRDLTGGVPLVARYPDGAIYGRVQK